MFVFNWSKEVPIPVKYSFPVPKPVVDVDERVSSCATVKEVLDQDFLQDNIES